jgi:glycosyltransferase involved in cell wall biosynthesis
LNLFLGKQIILDAGWSLFEGTVISRNKYGFLGVIAFKNYFIDFFSSHIAQKILLESKAQEKFYRRLFLVRSKKLAVIYTGVNEEAFSDVSIKAPAPIFFKNKNVVLFRGKYNAESGIKILAKATKLLSAEQITFWVFCPGLPKGIKFSENTYVSREYIKSQSVIAGIYNYAQLTIGQLSTHSRLNRTLPHKAFESAYLSKPYVSLGSLGIKELFLENFEFICLESSTPAALADKIKSSMAQPESIKQIGRNMKVKYESTVSQKILSQRFIDLVSDLK